MSGDFHPLSSFTNALRAAPSTHSESLIEAIEKAAAGMVEIGVTATPVPITPATAVEDYEELCAAARAAEVTAGNWKLVMQSLDLKKAEFLKAAAHATKMYSSSQNKCTFASQNIMAVAGLAECPSEMINQACRTALDANADLVVWSEKATTLSQNYRDIETALEMATMQETVYANARSAAVCARDNHPLHEASTVDLARIVAAANPEVANAVYPFFRKQ